MGNSPNCSVCGRFTGYVCDSSTPFGGPSDIEPPDEEFYCLRCANELEDECVREGRMLNCNWRKALWERRAAKRLGYVEAYPFGVAWTHWVKADSIPDGWVGIERVEALYG